MTAKTPELRLVWRHTWPDKGEDYCATDPADGGRNTNCRVYPSSAPGRLVWRWMASDRFGNLGQGWEESAKDAALAAEAAYWSGEARRTSGSGGS